MNVSVGGFSTQQKHVGQEGVLYSPIPKVRQVEAVKFLQDNGFATPAWAINRDILRRVEPIGAELRSLNAAIGTALAKAADRSTRAHLEGARDQIAKILDPKFAPGGAAGGPPRIFGFDELFQPLSCWPDFVIEP